MNFAVALLLLFTSPTLNRKFGVIEREHSKPGTRILTTKVEWNAWAQDEMPVGVTQPRIELGYNRVTVSATVDFLKIAGLVSNGPLQTVTAFARVQSANGQARVDIDRVQVGIAALEGAPLHLLMDRYVLPNYPDVVVGKWFPLRHRIERLEIRPGGVTVVTR